MTRTFGPCNKCGGDDIGVSYHDGRKHCRDCSGRASCQYSKATCGEYGKDGDHLLVSCRRCRDQWIEPIGATQPEPEGVSR